MNNLDNDGWPEKEPMQRLQTILDFSNLPDFKKTFDPAETRHRVLPLEYIEQLLGLQPKDQPAKILSFEGMMGAPRFLVETPLRRMC